MTNRQTTFTVTKRYVDYDDETGSYVPVDETLVEGALSVDVQTDYIAIAVDANTVRIINRPNDFSITRHEGAIVVPQGTLVVP